MLKKSVKRNDVNYEVEIAETEKSLLIAQHKAVATAYSKVTETDVSENLHLFNVGQSEARKSGLIKRFNDLNNIWYQAFC